MDVKHAHSERLDAYELMYFKSTNCGYISILGTIVKQLSQGGTVEYQLKNYNEVLDYIKTIDWHSGRGKIPPCKRQNNPIYF